MRNVFLVLLLAALHWHCYFEAPETVEVDPTPSLEFAKQLDSTYADYHNPVVAQRRFNLETIQPALDALGESFTLTEAGRSLEGRRLNRVEWGNGNTQVLLWSQMHGDEPTATQALLDVFNWLGAKDDGMDSIRTQLARQLTLTFLPMLNPDGAAQYQRRNALGVDLNRDALRLQSPEAKLLKGERDRLDAAWGFNLHDQSRYYGVGFPPKRMAGLSILAPAYDWEKSVNEQRGDAMQLIALMNRSWQITIPDGVGRYNDDFEPRAFGDNLQKWGTRTILIESGGHPDDREKQQLRKLNYVGILSALHAIASGSYEGVPEAEYWEIPDNSSGAYHDLLIRDLAVEIDTQRYHLDVGYRQYEIAFPNDELSFYLNARISDLGDLHTFGAYETVDGDGLTGRIGKLYPKTVSMAELPRLLTPDFYASGYTAVRVSNVSAKSRKGFTGARLLSTNGRFDKVLAPGRAVDLVLYRGEEWAGTVVNGHFVRP